MRMVDIISKKRDGKELENKEIEFFIKGYTEGRIPDYQASALAMAIYFQGMNYREMSDLTMAMVKSGETIDLSEISGIKVDKHSTGGVGDKTTIVLAPLVASLGIPIAKMSGRGLGYTGGTIDKLESISGFQTEITKERFIKLVKKNKIAIVSQTGNLTPADKKLYSLRDVTGTVNSMPLIASSIMSKKIASGTNAIVLDVKVGTGAFMKTDEDAKKLAYSMVKIGNSMGRDTVAIISNMSQPLGLAIGNALEIEEAIETLKGNGPSDLEELVLTLGSQMVLLAKKANTLKEARGKLIESIKTGRALKKFKTFIEDQGGNSEVIDNPRKLPHTKYSIDIPSRKEGFVSNIITNEIGNAAMLLGAGRAVKEDKIDLAAGIMMHKKIGDKTKIGDPLVTIYSNRDNLEDVIAKIYSSIYIGDYVERPELIHGIITK